MSDAEKAKGAAPKQGTTKAHTSGTTAGKTKVAPHKPTAAAGPKEPARLLTRYRKEVAPGLQKEFDYKNVNQIPTLEKVTINFGLGEAVGNPNLVKTGVEELTLIAGQRAVTTRAKKAIANFKLRAGLPIGCMVTLRRRRMWEFLDRLVNVAMPRIRDFKGVSGKAFDGRGNYSMGLREQTIFVEIDYDKVDKIKGFNITITTTANSDAEGKALLKALGMPFRN